MSLRRQLAVSRGLFRRVRLQIIVVRRQDTSKDCELLHHPVSLSAASLLPMCLLEDIRLMGCLASAVHGLREKGYCKVA